MHFYNEKKPIVLTEVKTIIQKGMLLPIRWNSCPNHPDILYHLNTFGSNQFWCLPHEEVLEKPSHHSPKMDQLVHTHKSCSHIPHLKPSDWILSAERKPLKGDLLL